MFKRNKFVSLWLIIGVVMGFLAVVFFSLTYLNNKILCNLDCRMRNEVVIVLVLLSLFGMFIGSLTYYFISEKYERKIFKIHKDMNAIYNLVDKDERKILKAIVENKGRIKQSELVEKTGLTRVKVSRILKNMEHNKVIIKRKKGMTNDIMLTKLFMELVIS